MMLDLFYEVRRKWDKKKEVRNSGGLELSIVIIVFEKKVVCECWECFGEFDILVYDGI